MRSLGVSQQVFANPADVVAYVNKSTALQLTEATWSDQIVDPKKSTSHERHAILPDVHVPLKYIFYIIHHQIQNHVISNYCRGYVVRSSN